ncbi:hypothetical protein AVEN_61963-1 [Araneus ventricosus]|uniref:Uncharacterized protein n=1 Tax=Araneus ventricosus TaxID=182803 RepID=A0A4Y2P0N5_ARAVE|nr:hypothetical protein AVEN_61963-1 [Araneus ventricosus]
MTVSLKDRALYEAFFARTVIVRQLREDIPDIEGFKKRLWSDVCIWFEEDDINSKSRVYLTENLAEGGKKLLRRQWRMWLQHCRKRQAVLGNVECGEFPEL